MTNTAWIIIGILIALLFIVGLVVIVGNSRKKSKTVSFEKKEPEAQKELTQEEKSGNYQAKGGFNFAPAGVPTTKDKEPIRVDAPLNTTAAAPKAKAAAAEQPQQPAPAEPEPAKDEARKVAVTPAEKPNKDVPAEDASGAETAAAEKKTAEKKTAEKTAPAKKAAEDKTAEKPDEKEAAEKKTGEKEAADKAPAEAVGTPVGNPVSEPDADEALKEKPAEPANAANAAKAATAAKAAKEDAKPAAAVEDAGADEPVDAPAEAAAEADAVEAADEAEAVEAAAAAKTVEEAADQALEETDAPADPVVEEELTAAQEQEIEEIAPAAGRIGRLRGRLSRSQNAIGQGLLGILSAGDLDEDAWEEIEDTLILADLGAASTMKVVDQLREKIAERGVASEEEARAMLRETLIEVGKPEFDRSIKAMPNDGKPAVILVVGVNGTGKTTTTGKLARVLVSMGHTVLLGAADTFRAAAADQLETWGRRVGASTVRGAEGADPASVAFDAVKQGVDERADVVLIDTAGRLHTSTGLMDQLGKVKRVVEKKSQVDEVLLVLDATVGQNGLNQARVFKDVVEITGVVLTKLDGTAKGGIVFQVQEELGVPVKLVGLGEGADDLAPFEVEGFVDALLGTSAQ
ncbi:fused signal recognition particle receptor [Corynebacterium aquatimens]|uniref:Signal recognition particle receptor FtsY n=2 Tax=Corynebacterium aquatimens TaxID=1190508 RepID=A0A931DX43_9CORY|nr:fused signal recognition particle receptor [Corynebacterium aquatimens]